MLDPQELDTLFSRSNTHIASKGQVVNHPRIFTRLSIIHLSHLSRGSIPTALSDEN